jgi:hypothetical protein
MNNAISEIIKLSSFILMLVYGFGYTFMNSYYSNFGIDIINYITVTDILLLSISILFNVAIGLVIVLGFFYATVASDEAHSFTKNDAKYVFNLGLKHYILFLIVLLIVALVLIYTTDYDFYIQLILLASCILFVFLITNDKKVNKKNKSLIKQIKFLYFGIIFFFFFVALKAGIDAGKSIKENNSVLVYNGIEFLYKERKYSPFSDDCLRVIGETNEYFILYDFSNYGSLIFAKSEITDLIIYDPSVYKQHMLFK